jgi:alpha-methylacyl-CoA racemase
MGPLAGTRIIEVAGIGPGPFAAMMLADMGADVVRVDRTTDVRPRPADRPRAQVLNRGRRSVALDLKSNDGVATLLRMIERADALIEGFRPGVMERLGCGPDVCLARHPGLVYGRMTGFGQEGPLAHAAGHDINYIALTGALHAIGRRSGAPVAPLNLVGDFGGGGLLLAFGIVCALLERASSGRGQVVDAAMVDGASSLMALMYGMRAMGAWSDERGANLLDTGAPFYDCYETRDGRYVAIGALEPQFYATLLARCGLAEEPLPAQMDRAGWELLRKRLVDVFKSRTRDEWCTLLEGTDACFAPVLSMEEAPRHPHNVARGTFVSPGGVPQPAPAPRFSRTPPELGEPPAHPGEHTDAVLANYGFSASEIESLRAARAVA